MLRVQYQGRPTPEVTWTVDKEVLEPGHGVEIHTTPKHSSLMVYDTERSDAGVYSILVKNKHGSDRANISIKIIGMF